jgi:competence protein ComFB
MRPHDYVEEEVFRATDQLSDVDAEFCGCQKCRADVAAIALCQLPPMYATGEDGAIAAGEGFSDPVFHATVLTTVNVAIGAVKAHPRHAARWSVTRRPRHDGRRDPFSARS